MRCKRCLRVFRGPFKGEKALHSWSKQECGICHFLGFRGRRTDEIRGSPRRGTMQKSHRVMDMAERHKVKVTEQNISLYCKVSQIIRGKKCRKNVVLSAQNRNTSD